MTVSPTILPIQNPSRVFQELGGLHDARIEWVRWSIERMELTVKVDDVYSNFRGFPEYRDIGPCSFTFHQVKTLAIEVDPINKHLKVYNLEVQSDKQSTLVEVRIEFAPGGLLKLFCESVGADKRLR